MKRGDTDITEAEISVAKDRSIALQTSANPPSFIFLTILYLLSIVINKRLAG